MDKLEGIGSLLTGIAAIIAATTHIVIELTKHRAKRKKRR